MGVLNVTQDSFSDGGLYLEAGAACARIDEMLKEGADWVDIGAESSRPGAVPVPAALQQSRLEAPLKHAVGRAALVSVDTTDPGVADFALECGAHAINDVSCLSNRQLAEIVARHGGTLVLSHCRGPMQLMAGFSNYPEDGYNDVVADVVTEWRAARDQAVATGLSAEDIFFDPGIGFAKSARHSFEALSRLSEFRVLEVPIVVGVSRKSFIHSLDGSPFDSRLGGSLAAALLAVQRGAEVVRVHDVHEHRQALLVARRMGALRAGTQAVDQRLKGAARA